MQWLEAKVTYEAPNIALTAEQIADIFYALGAAGVVVDDPELGVGEDWGDDAVPMPDKPAVTAYLPVDEKIGHQCVHLNDRLAAMSYYGSFDFSVGYRRVDEQDWAESWKSFFHPEKVSEQFVIKPSWRDYAPTGSEKIVEIDPGMAFGTGTHPTTVLCIRLLEKYCRPGCALLDVGTGSGILMIVAHKLGAASLAGVDNDPVAVEVARRNLVLNKVPEEATLLKTGDLVAGLDRRYDVVVANILADVIVDLLDAAPDVIAPQGLFICSGIIASLREMVLDKLTRRGFTLLETVAQGGWIAIAARKERSASD